MGEPALSFGVALHRGNITYGNIGTEKRLDFTVIGPAVNEASRIEGLCKGLGQPVLISSRFAASVDCELQSSRADTRSRGRRGAPGDLHRSVQIGG